VLTYLLTQSGLLERVLDVVIAVLDTKGGDLDIEQDDPTEENGDAEDDRSNDYEQDNADLEWSSPEEAPPGTIIEWTQPGEFMPVSAMVRR
jgi:hypothetical protein